MNTPKDPRLIRAQLEYAQRCEESTISWLELAEDAMPTASAIAGFCLMRAADNHQYARQLQARYAPRQSTNPSIQ